MRILVIGVNHKTASIALREKLAFDDSDISTALQQLQAYTESCLILSTCNRTEVYALLKDTELSHANLVNDTQNIDDIKHWLAHYKNIDFNILNAHLYVYCDHQAITHWIRVATGLDSMIIGESHILGQLKKSVNHSLAHGQLTSQFGWIVDQIFSSAKQIRHATSIGTQAVTLGFVIAKLASSMFDDLSQCHLLIIATGKINRLVASYIAEQNIGKITLANRNIERASALAGQLKDINPLCEINVIHLDDLNQHLLNVDIVSSCSGSMNTLIDFKMGEELIKQRSERPILMVDLAVPRDIEDSIKHLKNIQLYSIDDLQYVIADNLEQRKQAAIDAEILVSQLVVEIEQNFLVRQVGSDINKYRQLAHEQADTLLKDSLHNLQQGTQPAEEILKELSRRLTQTLTHAPSKLMRTVACEADPKTSMMILDELTQSYRQKN